MIITAMDYLLWQHNIFFTADQKSVADLEISKGVSASQKRQPKLK